MLKEKKLPCSNGLQKDGQYTTICVTENENETTFCHKKNEQKTECLIEQDSASKHWLSQAVLYATINDDCATLEGIADWARKENLDEENPKGDAMVLACLKDLRHCIEPLYKY